MTISLAQFEHITSAAGLSAVQADELKTAHDLAAAGLTLPEPLEVTGSRGGATATVLAELLTALAVNGYITDSTTA